MPRRSRVVLNREALDEVHAAFADGVFDLARGIVRVAEADAPDRTPYGEGLVDRGGAAVWVSGRKTHEMTTNPADTRVRLPRGYRLKTAASKIVGLAGFGFPALFIEFGTLRAPAKPFFTPAAREVIGDAQVILSAAMSRRLGGKRSKKTLEIHRRVTASRAAKAGG